MLVGDIDGVLESIVADSGYAALAQVGIDVVAEEGRAGVVGAYAAAYARDRGAELVGMRYDELGRLVDNPSAEWAIDDSTRDFLRGSVTDAIEGGWSNDRLSGAISDSYGFSEERAMTIARTETQMAANAGAVAGYKASGVVERKVWITAEDDLVEEDCIANSEAGPEGDGVIGIDEDYPSGDDAPPAHPNAVLAGSTFAPYGELQEMVGADYHGPAVLLETAQHKFLTIGPNHPILTRRGMVKARSLREGDDLVYDLRLQESAPSAKPNFEQMPFVEDAFQALRAVRPASRIAASSHDLHGDGLFCKGEVEVIEAACGLLPILDPCGIEHCREGQFVRPDMETVAPARDSASGLGFDTVHLSTPSSVRGGLPRHFGYLPLIRIIHYAEWEGKAFDATTETGLYNSGGFVVSNCRCVIAPVVDFGDTEQPQE